MAFRMVDENIHDDEILNQMPIAARWVFEKMFLMAEYQSGVGRGNTAFIRSKALPCDNVSIETVQEWLDLMVEKKRVIFFERAGERFYAMLRFYRWRGTLRRPPRRVLPLPSPELLRDYPDTLKFLTPEYAVDGICPDNVRTMSGQSTDKRALAGGQPCTPCPAVEDVVEDVVGGGVADDGHSADSRPPASTPPASRGIENQKPAGRSQERSPFVRQIWARCLETITPPGAPRELDDPTADAIERLLARRADEPEFAHARLFELLGQIAKSDKHGAGGSFVIGSPLDLLRKSHSKDPHSKLQIDEMEGKFRSAIETPEARSKRARSEFFQERGQELEQGVTGGKRRPTAGEVQKIREQVEDEWMLRAAGPAPPPAPGASGSEDQGQAKEGAS